MLPKGHIKINNYFYQQIRLSFDYIDWKRDLIKTQGIQVFKINNLLLNGSL
tara:strand:- start:1463 stop:1615 length:153 start_codon:yes stop_codon:yes gene_type:complete